MYPGPQNVSVDVALMSGSVLWLCLSSAGKTAVRACALQQARARISLGRSERA